MAKKGMAVCIPLSGRPVDPKWALSLPMLMFPVGMSVAWLSAVSQDRAKNRIFLLEHALKYDCSHALFLDDDTVCPPYGPQWLFYEMSQDPSVAVCAGIYTTKENPPSPLVFDALGGGPKWDWKQNEVFECAGVGTGCMMIDLAKLKSIPEPWFSEIHEAPKDAQIDRAGDKIDLATERGTDDLYFCKKITDAGYKILAHGGVLPAHLDQQGVAYSLPDTSFPMQGFERYVHRVKPTVDLHPPEMLMDGHIKGA